MTDQFSTDADLPWASLVTKAMGHLQLQTTLQDRFMNLSSAAWAVDIGAGTITFTSPERQAVAPVQIIGTLNTSDNTWMWGWDHPSVPEPLAAHARAVRAYGQAHGLDRLTTRVIPVTEQEAWEFTAVADLLGGAQCAYRGPAGPALVFMTFGNPTLSAPGAPADASPPPLAAPQSPGPQSSEPQSSEPQSPEPQKPEPQAEQPRPSGAEPGPEPDATPALIPVPGFSRPRAMQPAGIPTEADVDTLAGPAPEFTAEQAIGVVQSYMRQMHPIYHQAPRQVFSNQEYTRRYDAQEQLREAFWRRTDSFHKGGVLGSGNDYQAEEMRDWDARPVQQRLWQVTYRRPLAEDLSLNEGYLIMLFDDAPQFVDLIEDAD